MARASTGVGVDAGAGAGAGAGVGVVAAASTADFVAVTAGSVGVVYGLRPNTAGDVGAVCPDVPFFSWYFFACSAIAAAFLKSESNSGLSPPIPMKSFRPPGILPSNFSFEGISVDAGVTSFAAAT